MFHNREFIYYLNKYNLMNTASALYGNQDKNTEYYEPIGGEPALLGLQDGVFC